MPMKRFRKRRTFRRRGGKKLATQRYVKATIAKELELKYYQDSASLSGQIISTTAFIWNISPVPQSGTNVGPPYPSSDTTRIGDKIKLKRVVVKMNIQCSQVAVAGATDDVRIIMFQWYPNTSLAVPALSDILFNTTASTICQSFYNHDKANQHQILYDKRFRLLGATNTSQKDITVKPSKRRLKFTKKQIEFTAGGNTASNHLYIMMVADKAVTTNNVTATGISKIWFTDA